MALKGLDIFQLTPKTNCKDCGNPTCMAFSMKVAQGAISLDKCPHMSEEALTKLGDAAAPPMKTIKLGVGENEVTLGGETVMFRHDKTFVSKPLYAVELCANCVDTALPDALKIDYVRIGERMFIEMLALKYSGNTAEYVALIKKAAAPGRVLILNCNDADAARSALEICADGKPLLNGANESNYEAMSALATEFGVALGVTADNLDALYDTVVAIEKLGNKNLVLDVGTASVKSAFENAVQIRRAVLKDGDRNFGYPSLVNIGQLAPGDNEMQTALASLFTCRYGSIIVMEEMAYSQAIPLYGLRQNIFTDPQKPMKVEPGIYPLNGADENAICATTVDFALTYFIVSGELERSGVPVNLLISDAGGYSVLTAWAAGKLSASSIARYFSDFEIENKIKSRKLIIPGKVAVLKGEIENNLPGWEIIVAPSEAVALVKFMKDI